MDTKGKETGMTFSKALKLNISVICLGLMFATPAISGIQSAWDNPNANMTSGSIKPGYAQLTWSEGSTLPVK